MLTEPAKFSIGEIRDWLQKETGPALTPVQAQAQKRLEETRLALQNLTDASKILVDVSQKEIEKRNMKVYNRARALNKLANMFIERLKKLDVPDKVSFDSVNSFASEAQKVIMVTDVDIKNWFPHISPFFIMDRRKFQPVFDKTKITINTLNDFVNKEYIKTKTQEKTFQLLTDLQTLEAQLAGIEAQKANLKNERLNIETEIDAIERQVTSLKDNAVIGQLGRVDAEQETLNNELKNVLRHLQKPFIKMQALATSGGGAGVTPDELRKLTQYLENPFEAMATEENNGQVLKEILQKLSGLMSEDKLKLKSDKQRKAEQTVEDILKQDSLAAFRIKCIDVATRKKQLSNSSELEEAKQGLYKLQQDLDKLKFRQASLEADEAMKASAASEVQEKIRSTKRIIEANILSFLGKQIQIT